MSVTPGRKGSFSRLRKGAVRGLRLDSPSSLGLLFLLGLSHELAHGRTETVRSDDLKELLQLLQTQPEKMQALVEMIVEAHPEIADLLLIDPETGQQLVFDPAVLAEQLAELEAGGYLEAEEAHRLLASLRALEELRESASEDDEAVQLAQAGSAKASTTDAGGGAQGAGEAGAVDIEALPPPGAGPLAALGPLFVGGAAIVGVEILDKPLGGVPDTTSPTYVSTSTSIASQTVTLTYSEALATTGQPLAGSFLVQTRPTAGDPWTDATITGVNVSGSTVTITLQGTPLAAGRLLQVSYTDPSAGNDANAIQDLAGNDASSVVIATGIVADGYVSGAQIYIDTNGNGVADASELLTGVVTDANGLFFLPDSANGPILAVGGTNIDTGVANTVVLKAPAGATMVTPLTTLVQTYVEQNGGTVANANSAVLSGLGLTLPAGQTLTTYDPLAVLASNASDPTALAVQKVAAQVASIAQAASAAPAAGTSAAAVSSNVISNIVNQIVSANAGSTTVSLGNATTVSDVLASAGTTVNATTVANTTANIAAASNLNGIVTEQARLLDTVAPAAPGFGLALDSGVSAADGITNNGTVNVTGLESVGTWQYSTNGGGSWTTGSGSSFTLPGSALYLAGAVQVRQLDVAGNVSAAAVSSGNITVGLGTPLTIPSGTETAVINALVAQGNADGYLNVLDLADNATTLSDAQASALVQAGLVFAADDNVTLAVDNPVAGTQLQTSLKGMQTLGVDTLAIAGGAGDVMVSAFNPGETGPLLSSLPALTGTARVGIDVTQAEFDSFTAADLQAFGTGGFDLIGADGVASGALSITDAQATNMINAGLVFADQDDISLDVAAAASTQLQTSLAGLQGLGVDSVDVSGGGSVVINAGTGAIDFGALPQINGGASDTLNFSDTGAAALTAGDLTSLAGAGFDLIGASDGSFDIGEGHADAMIAAGLEFVAADAITLHAVGTELSPTTNVSDLSSLGVDAVSVVDTASALDSAIGFNSANAADLITHGIDLFFTNSDNTLDVTLARLAEIGTDRVFTDSLTPVTLEVDLGGTAVLDINQLQTALNDIVTAFETNNGAVIGSGINEFRDLFEGGDTVNLNVTGTFTGDLSGLDPGLVAKLELLGIDDILNTDGTSLK